MPELPGSNARQPNLPPAGETRQRLSRRRVPILTCTLVPRIFQVLKAAKTSDVRSLRGELRDELNPALQELDRLRQQYESHGLNPNDTHGELCTLHDEILTGDQIICGFVANTLGHWIMECDRELAAFARRPLSDDHDDDDDDDDDDDEQQLRQQSLREDKSEVRRAFFHMCDSIRPKYDPRIVQVSKVPSKFGHFKPGRYARLPPTSKDSVDDDDDVIDIEEGYGSDETMSEGEEDMATHEPFSHHPNDGDAAPADHSPVNLSWLTFLQNLAGDEPPGRRVVTSREPPIGIFRQGRHPRLLPRSAVLVARPSVVPCTPTEYRVRYTNKKRTATSPIAATLVNNDSATVPAVPIPNHSTSAILQGIAATILRASGERPDLVPALNDNLRGLLPQRIRDFPRGLRNGVNKAREAGELQYDADAEGGLAFAKGRNGPSAGCKLAPYQDAMMRVMVKYWDIKDRQLAETTEQ